MDMLDDVENAFAKLLWNPEMKQFVLKNKYCTHCSKQSHYYCDVKTSRQWSFQQELAYFKIVSITNNPISSQLNLSPSLSFLRY